MIPSMAESRDADPLTLMTNVANHYAQATSYHIEAIEERTTMNELDRDWEKILLTAIEAPRGRYRYEARTGHGSAAIVSDGKTKWTYHVEAHMYTTSAAAGNDVGTKRVFAQEEMEIGVAKALVAEIRTLPSLLKSAKLLPDETIELNGRKIECFVVSFKNSDLEKNRSSGGMEVTIWIDKSANVVLKNDRKSDTYTILPGSSAHIPMVSEETITYPVTVLDKEEPDSTFVFTPPADAKLVASFPEIRSHRTSDIPVLDLMGKPAPDISFKDVNGKVTILAELRGKPIFIEFWATWCPPCVNLFPDLKKLHEETATKGLVWISVDNDDDPSTATRFLSEQHVTWRNYHDGDDSIGKAFGRHGIPLGVLIDPTGGVTFYRSGYNISELRAAISKLGTQFNAIAQEADFNSR